jgi:hypothetical protein
MRTRSYIVFAACCVGKLPEALKRRKHGYVLFTEPLPGGGTSTHTTQCQNIYGAQFQASSLTRVSLKAGPTTTMVQRFKGKGEFVRIRSIAVIS